MTAITASHVADVHKPITNRSAVDRAEKTRQTLATAAAILRASGGDRMTNELAAMQLDRSIAALNAQIRAYYTDNECACGEQWEIEQ